MAACGASIIPSGRLSQGQPNCRAVPDSTAMMSDSEDAARLLSGATVVRALRSDKPGSVLYVSAMVAGLQDDCLVVWLIRFVEQQG